MGYFHKVDVQCSKQLHEVEHDLPFLPEKMKIKKLKNPVCNLYGQKIFYTHKKFETSIKSQISI